MSLCKILLPSDALCTVALIAAASITAGLQKPAPAGGAQKPGQEPGKTVEAGMPKLAPEHTQLKKMVGNWDATVTNTMPGEPTKTSTAKAEYKAVGDTWVESTFTGEMDGKPYVGHGVDGYDTLKNKYVSLWVDSWSTEMHLFEGTASGNATTLTGDCHDPATGKTIHQRLVTEMKDNDSMTLRMFTPGPDGKEVEGMKIEFKRRK